MQLKQHKNATTTPAIRKWIQENSHLSTARIMRGKGLLRNTVEPHGHPGLLFCGLAGGVGCGASHPVFATF